MKPVYLLSLFFLLSWKSTYSQGQYFALIKKEIQTGQTPVKSTPAAAFVSDWEKVSSWTNGKGVNSLVYSTVREHEGITKDILNKGVVLIYSKGYDLEGFSKLNKPLSLPFYLLSADEKIKDPFSWSFTTRENGIDLSLHMPIQSEILFEKGKSTIQLRYFIIPEEVLKKHDFTTSSLQKLSYKELTALLKVSE